MSPVGVISSACHCARITGKDQRGTHDFHGQLRNSVNSILASGTDFPYFDSRGRRGRTLFQPGTLRQQVGSMCAEKIEPNRRSVRIYGVQFKFATPPPGGTLQQIN
jgi:hypothetical protein